MIIHSFQRSKDGYTINLQQFTVEFEQRTKINCIGLYEYLHAGPNHPGV
jgi:hypothetical protein